LLAIFDWKFWKILDFVGKKILSDFVDWWSLIGLDEVMRCESGILLLKYDLYLI
jgi:hypothetical protein